MSWGSVLLVLSIPPGLTILSSDIKENVWIWHSEGTELYMDKGEIIRFKVENEKFTDQTPVNPVAAKVEVASVSVGAEGEEAKELAERQAAELHKEPPYQINVSEVFGPGGGRGKRMRG